MLKLLKQTQPQCHLYSAAMLLGESPLTLVEEIGETGLDVWYPNRYGYDQLRGHHEQEILDLFLRRGKALVRVEHYPTLQWPSVLNPDDNRKYMPPSLEGKKIWELGRCSARLYQLLKDHRAILIGQYRETGRDHAIAWDGEYCYDPNGIIYPIEDFLIREAWIVVEFSNQIRKET